MSIDPVFRQKRERGVTLIELIVFIVIVSVALYGILSVFNVTVRNSADPLQAKQALAIAESLMEEIQSKDFDNSAHGSSDFVPSTPPAASERQSFDDVMDFNTYGALSLSPTVLRTGLHDIAGNAIDLLARFKVLVTVEHPAAAIGGVATDKIWLITVQVTDAANQVHVLTGYRIHYD